MAGQVSRSSRLVQGVDERQDERDGQQEQRAEDFAEQGLVTPETLVDQLLTDTVEGLRFAHVGGSRRAALPSHPHERVILSAARKLHDHRPCED